MIPGRPPATATAPHPNTMPTRSLHCRLLGAFLGLAALVPALPGDEVRLADGRVLVGRVERTKGRLVVTTRDGRVEVDEALVTRVRTEAELRAALVELERRAGDTAFARLQLAQEAWAMGLDADLWRHLDALASAAGTSPSLDMRHEEFLLRLAPAFLPPQDRAAAGPERARALLQRAPRDCSPGRRDALVALLAHDASAEAELRRLARSEREPHRRWLAVTALQDRGGRANQTFAWRTTVLDPTASVRTQAVEAVPPAERDAATDYLAAALGHRSPEVRVRTAEALAALGSLRALAPLVAAGPAAARADAANGTAPRAHVAFVEQQSYLRDFDVEVASSSFIANPQVGILQSGAVLDVTVLGMQVETVRVTLAYRRALRRLAGSDPGADVRAWPGWLARVQAETVPLAPPTTGAGTAAPAGNGTRRD